MWPLSSSQQVHCVLYLNLLVLFTRPQNINRRYQLAHSDTVEEGGLVRRNGQQAMAHTNRRSGSLGSSSRGWLQASKVKLTAALFFSCLRGFSSKAAVVQCPPFYPEPAPTASAAASTAAVVQSPPGNPAFYQIKMQGLVSARLFLLVVTIWKI